MKLVKNKYIKSLDYISYVVEEAGKTDWYQFTDEEKLATQNTVLLVGLLYKMCQVNLVEKSENEKDLNVINKDLVNKTIKNAEQVLSEVA